MLLRLISSPVVCAVLLAAALAVSAPGPIQASQSTGAVLADQIPGPHDAPTAEHVEDGVAADPIHPWDNNDFTDSVDSSQPEPMRRLKLPQVGPGKPAVKNDLRKGTGTTLPDRIEFVRNLPNPFNAQTRVEFALAQGGRASLEIYNLLGQLQNRVEWSHLDPGMHSWLWQGTSADGRSLPSGVYFYRLEVEQTSAIGRMVLLK